MGSTVQARLDDETQEVLAALVRQTGMSQSEVIREGIRLMKQHKQPKAQRKLVGIGCFDSGLTDLSTNKMHMAGFGQLKKKFRQSFQEEPSR